jgi:hypothetical protein
MEIDPNSCGNQSPPRSTLLDTGRCESPCWPSSHLAAVDNRKSSRENRLQRWAPAPASSPSAPGDPPPWRRLEQTALVPHSPLGWAEISHPFHPLRGRRFEVLKKRRVAGVDTLILRELERGTLSVPREWTDWADPSPYDSLTRPPHQLAADCLFELVALLDALPASRPSSPGKDPQEKD